MYVPAREEQRRVLLDLIPATADETFTIVAELRESLGVGLSPARRIASIARHDPSGTLPLSMLAHLACSLRRMERLSPPLS